MKRHELIISIAAEIFSSFHISFNQNALEEELKKVDQTFKGIIKIVSEVYDVFDAKAQASHVDRKRRPIR